MLRGNRKQSSLANFLVFLVIIVMVIWILFFTTSWGDLFFKVITMIVVALGATILLLPLDMRASQCPNCGKNDGLRKVGEKREYGEYSKGHPGDPESWGSSVPLKEHTTFFKCRFCGHHIKQG